MSAKRRIISPAQQAKMQAARLKPGAPTPAKPVRHRYNLNYDLRRVKGLSTRDKYFDIIEGQQR